MLATRSPETSSISIPLTGERSSADSLEESNLPSNRIR